jgi:hypothetical protein
LRAEPAAGEVVPRFVTFLRTRLIFFQRNLVPQTALFAGRFFACIVLDDCGGSGVRVLYEPLAFSDKACGSDRG